MPTRAAGPLQLPERAAQRFDLLLVAGFLPLGHFCEFKHVFHLAEHALERFNNLRDLVDRLADGGALRSARGRNLTGDCGNGFQHGGAFRCRLRARCRRRNEWQRRATTAAATAATTMSSPTRALAGDRFLLSALWHVWANHAPYAQK